MLNIVLPQDVSLQELPSYDEYLQSVADRSNADIGTLKGFDCPICKNKGYIHFVEDCNIKSMQCKCQKQRKVMRNLEKSGLAEVINDYNFANFDTSQAWQKEIKNKALEFIKQENQWFFIGGQSGSGKTHICTAICGSLLKQGKSVRYMLWVTEIRNLKSVVNDDVEYNKLFSSFANADVLYIDDLFKVATGAKLSDSDIQRTYELINARAITKKTTIFSSEKFLADIVDIDTAIGGRIKQFANGYNLKINCSDDKNWRLK